MTRYQSVENCRQQHDSTLATKRVAMKRSKQAVAEPILAGLEELQA